MSDVTVIGQGAHVRGKVSGASDVEIRGRVDGDVTIDGEVTIDASGMVGANVSATRVVVRGAVRGDLTGSDAVVLESGARVAGDVRAPRIAIAVGALVRGYVQTGNAGSPGARAASSARAAKPAAAPKSAATVAIANQPKKEPVRATSHVTQVRAPQAPPPRGATISGARPGPPPPIVPVLKKGAKGSLTKKRAG